MKRLKSYLFLLCFMVIGTLSVQAQFTVQVGINASSWRASQDGITIETDSRPGFNIGATYMTPISSKFMFAPGAFYTSKGATFLDDDVTQNYFEIPLTFIYQSNPDKGFFVNAGPYFAILMSADAAGEDIKEGFSSNDLGLGAGLGYDFGKFRISLNGEFGFSNIWSDDDVENFKFINSVGQLNFAYKL